MLEFRILDAFTGVSAFEKLGLIRFLEKNLNESQRNLNYAIEYALKERPSFGGFVLAATHNNKPVAVAVVNKSGIVSKRTTNELVYFSIGEKYEKAAFIQEFLKKIIEFSGGNLSIHLEEENTYLEYFKSMGFIPAKIEWQLCSNVVSLAV